MNSTATITRPRTTIITLTRPRTLAANHIISSCGTTYKYVRSMELPHFAILVECLCPEGHGANNNPSRWWLTRADATMACDFADITPRTRPTNPVTAFPSPADIAIIPIDILETLTLEQIAGVANTYRHLGAPAAA